MNNDRVTGAASNVAGKVENAFGQATGNAAREASGAAREATGAAQNLYGQAKDAVRDIGDSASGLAKDALDSAIDTGGKYYRDGSKAVAATVKDQPVGALLVAGAVGFALALLLNRQPPRRSLRDYYYR